MRCGDTVRLGGEDYEMEVAYADPTTGRFSWCGWPEGEAEISRALLVRECADDEHRVAVARWLDQGDPMDTRRQNVARLYRPRAYWRAVLDREYIRLAEQLKHVASIAAELAKAEAGPEDA